VYGAEGSCLFFIRKRKKSVSQSSHHFTLDEEDGNILDPRPEGKRKNVRKKGRGRGRRGKRNKDRERLTGCRPPITLVYGFPKSSDDPGTSNSTVYAAAPATAVHVIS
jgi:hypothetical protein